MSCKHIKARASLFPSNFLAKTFYFEAVGLYRVDRVLNDQGEQVFPTFFHVSEPVAITFDEQRTFRTIAATRFWRLHDEALAGDEILFKVSYYTKSKEFKPDPLTVGAEDLPEFHVIASADMPADAQWEILGTHVKEHRDIENAQLLYVVKHDNDFLSVEKEGSAFKLVFAPWIF